MNEKLIITAGKGQSACEASDIFELPPTRVSGSWFLGKLLPMFLLLLVIQTPLQAQQTVFSRGEVTTGNWWDAQNPWFYQTWNNSQDQPDLPFSSPNYTRNNLFIGHNNNLTMTTNGRVFQLRTLEFQSTATSARIINNNTGGISLSVGLTNSAAANHTFNTPITIDGTVSFSVVNGGTLSFGSAGTIGLGANTLGFTGDGNYSAGGVISGTGSISKSGNGTLTMSAAGTYTGGTSISGGMVTISTANNRLPLGPSVSGDAAGRGAVTITAGTLNLNGFNQSVGPLSGSVGSFITLGAGNLTTVFSGTNTLASVISGSGRLIKGSSAVSGSGTLVLAGTNTYSGGTTISSDGGVLEISSDNNLGTAPAAATTGHIVLGGGSGTNNANLRATANLTINANRGISINNATVSRLSASPGVTLEYNGIIAGTGSLSKLQDGTLVLGGPNTYSGATNIVAGVLNIRHNTALGTADNTTGTGTTVQPGYALELQGGITVGTELLTISGTGISSAGALRNISGDNVWGGTVSVAAATRITGDAGKLFLNGNINGSAASRAITFWGAGVVEINGAIQSNISTVTRGGAGGGAGTLILNGQNSHTGLTTVTSGTLQLNRTGGGTLPAANSVTCNGGILRISSDQTLNNLTVSSGTLVVDAGVTLTITGTFTGGGTIDNKGTINLQGGAPQTFPGAATTINNGVANQMNMLTITNASGVTLNKGFVVNGALDLVSGTLFIGNNNDLTVNGGISGAGNLGGSQTSELLLGGGSGTVSFATGSFNNYLKLLTLSGNADYTLGNTLNMTAGANAGVVTISGNAKLNTNGNLVLKSDAAGTASVAEITSTQPTPVVGEVTVERFIPQAPTVAPQTGRAWRILSIPVTSATATIRDAWAGGSFARVNSHSNGIAIPDQTPLNGVGTIITGHSYSSAALANAAGYDWWPELYIGPGQAAASSIRKYTPNATDGNFNSNTASRSIIATTLNAAEQAYMLFIRGNRTITTTAAGSGAALLAPKGNLRVGDVTITVPPSGSAKYFMYGNPYAATIDFEKVYNDNSTVIKNVISVWDATIPGTSGLGAYRTITRIGPNQWSDNFLGITPNVQYLHSSGGVLLQSNTPIAANLTTKETHKVTGTPAISPFSAMAVSAINQLSVHLNRAGDNNQLSLVAGATALFGEGLLPESADRFDISQLESFTGSLGISLRQPDKLMVFEGRPPVKNSDKLWVNLNGIGIADYALTVKSKDFSLPGVSAFLVDKYLNRQVPLALDGTATIYKFSGNADSLSKDAARFEIVFEVLPENVIQLNVTHAGPNNRAEWMVAKEDKMVSYTLEYYTVPQQRYKALITLPAKNTPNAQYLFNHRLVAKGSHFYRVAGLTQDGKTIYSNVVNITTDIPGAAFTLAPGLITSQSAINVQWENLLPANYKIYLYDVMGRQIQVTGMPVRSAGGTFTLNLPAGLPNGIYEVQLRGKGLILTQRFVKQ